MREFGGFQRFQANLIFRGFLYISPRITLRNFSGTLTVYTVPSQFFFSQKSAVSYMGAREWVRFFTRNLDWGKSSSFLKMFPFRELEVTYEFIQSFSYKKAKMTATHLFQQLFFLK